MPVGEMGKLFRAAEDDIIKVRPADKKKFKLEELQKFVGGYIELVPGTTRRGKPQAFCNEEGRLQRLQTNKPATIEFGIELFGDVIQIFRKKSKRAV